MDELAADADTVDLGKFTVLEHRRTSKICRLGRFWSGPGCRSPTGAGRGRFERVAAAIAPTPTIT
jgi:hypothetical protein